MQYAGKIHLVCRMIVLEIRVSVWVAQAGQTMYRQGTKPGFTAALGSGGSVRGKKSEDGRLGGAQQRRQALMDQRSPDRDSEQ